MSPNSTSLKVLFIPIGLWTYELSGYGIYDRFLICFHLCLSFHLFYSMACVFHAFKRRSIPIFPPPLRVSISPLADMLPFLSPPFAPLMDGQIMYIQSSSAPDAVRGCDKSPGREPSRAERRNGVTKRTRHLENTQRKKKKNAESQTAFVCLCVQRANVQPLLCPLSYCADLNSRTPLQFKTKIIMAKNIKLTADYCWHFACVKKNKAEFKTLSSKDALWTSECYRWRLIVLLTDDIHSWV